MRIWYVDVERRKPVQVGKERYWNPFGDDWEPVWSPDSQWLAYSTRLTNYLGRDSPLLARIRQSDADHRRHERRQESGLRQGWQVPVLHRVDRLRSVASARRRQLQRPVTRNIYLVVLSRTEPSPFAPESDEEKGDAAPPTAPAPRLHTKTGNPRRGRRPENRSR